MIETRGRKPYLKKEKKIKVDKDLKDTSLSLRQIAVKNAVSYWTVVKVKSELDEERIKPEPETFEVLKIREGFLKDAIRVLEEFQIEYELPTEKYELLEMFESKIN